MLAKKFLIILLFIQALFLTSSQVYAIGGARPTPTLVLKCGFAGVPGSDKCCDPKIVTDEDFEQTKEGLPGPLQGLIEIIKKLFNASKPEEKLKLNMVMPQCSLGDPVGTGASCVCKQTEIATPVATLETICEKYTKGNELNTCRACVRGGGITTALGCVPLNLGNFITDYLLGRLIGLAGVISFLCILYAAFMLQTSSGNPERIKKAQEMLTSCIMGLMLIIFSVFILRVIGVDILRIPFITVR